MQVYEQVGVENMTLLYKTNYWEFAAVVGNKSGRMFLFVQQVYNRYTYLSFHTGYIDDARQVKPHVLDVWYLS